MRKGKIDNKTSRDNKTWSEKLTMVKNRKCGSTETSSLGFGSKSAKASPTGTYGMLPSAKERIEAKHTFTKCYAYFCAMNNTAPKVKLKPDHRLEFFGDRIRAEDWAPIIKAISLDQSLKTIKVLSCNLIKPGTIRRPSINKSELLTEFVSALNKNMSASKLLTSVELQSLPLNIDHVNMLCQGLKSSTIQYFGLTHCNIGDAGCDILCTTIRYRLLINTLDLSGCAITEKGAEPIAQMIQVQKMERYGKCWEDSLRYRKPNTSNAIGLRRLILDGNEQLGDVGFSIILDALIDDIWMQGISCRNCGLTDDGAQKAVDISRSNRHISVIDIRRNFEVDSDYVKLIENIIKQNNLPQRENISNKKKATPKHTAVNSKHTAATPKHTAATTTAAIPIAATTTAATTTAATTTAAIPIAATTTAAIPTADIPTAAIPTTASVQESYCDNNTNDVAIRCSNSECHLITKRSSASCCCCCHSQSPWQSPSVSSSVPVNVPRLPISKSKRIGAENCPEVSYPETKYNGPSVYVCDFPELEKARMALEKKNEFLNLEISQRLAAEERCLYLEEQLKKQQNCVLVEKDVLETMISTFQQFTGLFNDARKAGLDDFLKLKNSSGGFVASRSDPNTYNSRHKMKDKKHIISETTSDTNAVAVEVNDEVPSVDNNKLSSLSDDNRMMADPTKRAQALFIKLLKDSTTDIKKSEKYQI